MCLLVGGTYGRFTNKTYSLNGLIFCEYLDKLSICNAPSVKSCNGASNNVILDANGSVESEILLL